LNNAADLPNSSPGTEEEIRFAVVLNGGVSLAVWMGGVAHEINELTRGAGPYGRLMRCLGVKARADVIAGTSAGGINGAALALGQVNQSADLLVLRDLWAEQGSMENLLQPPFKGKPTSLLRGDAYFLPQIHKAMLRLTQPWSATSKSARPIDLTITTTLLNGAYSLTTDSVGQVLPQLRHDGQFRFVRGVKEITAKNEEVALDNFHSPSDVAAALALASRCSAGFPLAFEPSFVPVNRVQDGDNPTPPERPDMAPYANWLSFGPPDEQTGDHSRYVVDGGVLANTPTRQALTAIQRMPSSHRVQRVMLLVYPHAPATWETRPDQIGAPPNAVGTMSHLLQTLTGEGSRTFVNEVEEHNRRAATREGVRADIVLRYRSDLGSLHAQAECVAELYRIVRRRRTARDFAARVELPTAMTFGQIRAAADQAQTEWLATHGHLPYLPVDLTDTGELLDAHSWAWGTTSAIDMADLAMRIIGAVQRRAPEGAIEIARIRKRIHGEISNLHRIRDQVEGLIDEPLEEAERQPDVGYWLRRLDLYAWLMNGDDAAMNHLDNSLTPDSRKEGRLGMPSVRFASLSDSGQKAAAAVAAIVRALNEVQPAFYATPRSDPPEPHDPDAAWIDLLRKNHRRADRDAQLLSVLMDLHIVSWTVGDEYTTENTSPVDLVQISAQTENGFARYSQQLHGKLGGASIARFSGFLKRSWRLNDWTWGRCDAATMLTRILLSPDRLRAISSRQPTTGGSAEVQAGAVVDHLLREVYAIEPEKSVKAWATVHSWANDLLPQAKAEVATALLGEAQSQPTDPNRTTYGLQKLTELLTYARHSDVMLEELPQVASAVVADRFDGANPRSRGERFVHQYDELIKKVERQNTDAQATPDARLALGVRALAAFDVAGIGREPLEHERSSDQMIRTAVTAASVGATVIDSPGAGLGRFNPITKFMRGAMQLPYWVAVGLTSAGTMARFLALAALGAGGVLLALALLGVLQGSFASAAAAVGAGSALFAFGYAALRTGSLLHGLVLLSAAVPLAAVGIHRQQDANARGLGTAAAAMAVVLALLVLGSLPVPLRSPLMTATGITGRSGRRTIAAVMRFRATWRRGAANRGRRLLRNGLVLAALLLLAWVVRSMVSDGFTWREVEHALWWCVGACAGLGLLFAWFGAALLGTWRWQSEVSDSPGAMKRLARWLGNAALGAWRTSSTGDSAGRWGGIPVSMPMGVTVGWSWVYGLLYSGVATTLGVVDANNMDVWIVGAQVAAIILFLIVPSFLLLVARKHVTSVVLKQARSGSYRLPAKDHLNQDLNADESPNLTAWLIAHDMAYRYLLNPRRDELKLRTAGRTLEARLRIELQNRAQNISAGAS
jgi:patatin-related protein